MSKGSIEARTASFKKKSKNSIYVRHKQVSPFPELKEVEEYVDNILLLADGDPFVILFDLRGIYQNWGSDAKRYINEHEEYNRLRVASVAIIDTLPIKLLANLYLEFFKPKNDVKIFDRLDKGEAWIKKKEKECFQTASI